jgi:hypothetical protein
MHSVDPWTVAQVQVQRLSDLAACGPHKLVRLGSYRFKARGTIKTRRSDHERGSLSVGLHMTIQAAADGFAGVQISS